MFQFRINSRNCECFGGFLGYVDQPIAMVPPPHNTNTDKVWAFIQTSVEIRTKDTNFPPRRHCDRHVYYSMSENSAITLKMEEEEPKHHHTLHSRVRDEMIFITLTLRSFSFKCSSG